MPFRHLATASSNIVVMPPCKAMRSISPAFFPRAIRGRIDFVHFDDFEQTIASAIAGPAAPLAALGLVEVLTRLKAKSFIAWIGEQDLSSQEFVLACSDRTEL